MKLQTLNDIFFAIAGREQPQLMLRKTEAGWEPVSSAEFATKVLAVANALRGWGISRGDRVAILSENRHEWVVADFACMMLGAVVVPIYTTLTPEQTAYILRDSGARAIFVSNRTYERVNPWRPTETVGQFPASSHIRLKLPMVAGDAESSLAGIVRETNDFVLPLAKPDHLALLVVTEDRCALAQLRRRGQHGGGDLNLRSRHDRGSRHR